MRKVLKSFALIAAAAMTLASCQNELQPEVTPGTVVSKGTVHVEFGATSNEPQTKVTLGTSDDIKFEADWISGTDKLWIDYVWETEDDLGDTAVLSDAWNGNSFEADLVGPKDIENQDLPAHWVYTCYYPQPRIESKNHYFAFGANRDQDGSNYAGQYDLMYGGAETTNSVAGKDGDNKVVFKMDRLTSIAYFHITTSGFDASEKLAKAVLEITEADDNIIACDEVYYVDGVIYKNGANQSSSITLNTTQAMDDIKLWYNVIPLTFRKATLTLTTDKGKYITLNMGDGVKEFAYMPGELQKAKIGPIPASAFTDSAPAEAFYTLKFTKNAGNSSYSSSHTETVGEVTWTVFGNSALGADLRVGGKSLSSTDRTLTSGSQFAESINKVVINHSGKYSKSGNSITVNSVSAILSTASNFASGTIVERQTISSPSVSSAGAIEINFDDAHEDCYVRIVVNATTTGSDNSYLIINSVELFEGNAKDKFAINIQPVTGGSITANKTSASEGTVITLVPIPNGDYDFTSWAVTNANTSASIEVVNNQFTMPAAPVNVSAVFTKKPYKVTYDKNTSDDTFEGTLPVDSNNYTDSSNEVTVLGATLTRTDYNFVGWNTQADGEGTDYAAGDKFTITASTTLYAKWVEKTYTVTLVPPTNGSYVIMDSNNSPLNDENYASFEAKYGDVLNYTYTPADGYRFRNWQVTDNSTHTFTAKFSWTMTRSAITIEGNFDVIPTHLVKFSVNGTIVNGGGEGETLDEGAAITFPADPAAIGDMKFQGWVTSAIDGTTDTKPSFVSKTGQTVGTEDVTYYAVFANVVEGTTSYKLVSSLTNGKNYIFVTRNTAGSGYALSSNVTTGTSVTIAESGADMVVSGTPAKTIIWTAATGWSLTNTGVDSNNKLEINGSTFAINDTGSTDLSWTTNYGLNGKSSSGKTSYYVQCTNTGTFSKSSTSGSKTNRVYAYEEDSTGGTSGYCTTVEIPAQVVSIAISGNVTKTTYNAGEQLSVAGLTVTGTLDDDTQRDLTNDSGLSWTFDPATLSVETTSCTATAHYQTLTDSYEATGLTVNAAVTLESVTVSGAPTKKEYKAGEAFDPAGLTVTGTYSDNHQETITEGITWSEPAALTAGQTSVTITATVNGITSEGYTVNGLTVTSKSNPRYVKVTQDSQISAGKYLIVFGTSAHATVNSKDLVATVKDLTITNNEIAYNDAVAAAEVEFATESGKTGYSVKLPSGKYLSCNAASNQVAEVATAFFFDNISAANGISGTDTKSSKRYLCINGTYIRFYTSKNDYTVATLYKYTE